METETSPYNKYVEKWHKKFRNEGIYDADPDPVKKKFFVNFPYPYINGYLHLGHGYTSLKADIIARLKRKQGFNVLFPQAFHATGQPIVAAAERVKEGEKKQIEILKKMGINDIERFKDPKEWIAFFSQAAYDHLNMMGYGIDWRRKFITTELNPAYDKFIRWQYKHLYNKGLIYKGTHPVVYCPKDKHAIGDHDRAEGEGVVPEKVVMIKFEDEKGRKFIAMTYRPETLWGVTNLWVNPDAEYAVYDTKEDKIVVSKDIVDSLSYQDIKGEIIETIKGKELLGTRVKNPITGDKVVVLPAGFVDPSIGSGIVMSVPSHAPYDYVALKDLESTEWKDIVRNIQMVSLIEVKGYGDYPAKDIVEKLGIKSQKDRALLDKATKEIYKVEYHQGRLKDVFGRFAGMYVKDAKNEIVEFLKEKGVAFEFYILPERVVCRCLTQAVVKIVKDQWFIKYSDRVWKDRVHKHIDKMEFYPEEIRALFHSTVDWLGDWAFTRERGLGTRFPIDESKLIESLSDSTIYMAYYTIAKYLENAKHYSIKIDVLKDSFFDYVFLGKGNVKEVAEENQIDVKVLESMREEFLYWYKGGFDLRISGKDLVKNHLTMMLFHHVAIFPEDLLPRGIVVNGFVMVDGEKMSKSKGNFYTLKDAYEMFGVEETRMALAYAGNAGIDDPNFETSLVKDIREKLVWFERFVEKSYGKGRDELKEIDLWLISKGKHLMEESIELFERLQTRDALKIGFFEMQNALKWYLRRTLNNPSKQAINSFIEMQLHVLSVVIPHYAQELWSKIDKNTYIIEEAFPDVVEYDEMHEVLEFEKYMEHLIEDIKEVKVLLERKGLKPKKMKIIVAEKWKYVVYDLIKGCENLKEVMSKAKAENFFDVDPKVFASFVNKNFAKIKKMEYEVLEREKEIEWLKESKSFLEKETNMDVEISDEGDNKAMPFKPAIYME